MGGVSMREGQKFLNYINAGPVIVLYWSFASVSWHMCIFDQWLLRERRSVDYGASLDLLQE